MKRSRRILLLCAIFPLLPGIASAQLLSGRFITSLYGWEKFDTVNVSNTYLRATQSMLLDLGLKNASLHTQIEGAGTLDSGFSTSTDLRIYNLYLDLKNIADVVDLSIGRQPYFAGAGFGTMDGLLAKASFGRNVRLTAYGGQAMQSDLGFAFDLKKNALLGGQLLLTPLSHGRIGLSYLYRQKELPGYNTIRLDELFRPVDYTIAPELDKVQIGSVDASYSIASLHFYGRYDYEFLSKKTLRGQFGIHSSVTDQLTLSAEMIHRAPRVPHTSFFSVFNISNNTEFEAGADYLFGRSIRAFIRGAMIAYDGDNSFRYTAGIATKNASLTYRGNSGYAGELSALSMQATYPVLENILIPTLGFTYSSYRLSSAEKDKTTTYAAILGATVRPMQLFSVDLQAQYLHNEIVKKDVRFFGRFNIWFSENLNIIK